MERVGETAFLSFCSNAFCEEGNRENDILTEKNCNQVYTSQALSF